MPSYASMCYWSGVPAAYRRAWLILPPEVTHGLAGTFPGVPQNNHMLRVLVRVQSEPFVSFFTLVADSDDFNSKDSFSLPYAVHGRFLTGSAPRTSAMSTARSNIVTPRTSSTLHHVLPHSRSLSSTSSPTRDPSNHIYPSTCLLCASRTTSCTCTRLRTCALHLHPYCCSTSAPAHSSVEVDDAFHQRFNFADIFDP